MKIIIFLFIGMMIGSILMTIIMSCLQINRINYYEEELKRKDQ